MPLFGLAPDFRTPPTRAPYDGTTPNGYFEDNNDVWMFLLGNPQVGEKEGSCVRGCVFNEDAHAATQLNVDAVHGLVLDVDEFHGRPLPQEHAHAYLSHALEGHRYIAWTTYNHRRDNPRYRVVVPLATPVSRQKYPALWHLINGMLGNIIGERQHNSNRLGYLPRLRDEAARADYAAWVAPGPLLDAEQRFGTLEEMPDRVVLLERLGAVEPDRSGWLTDEDAIGRARAYMRDAARGILPGSRHFKLFEKACQLWYDFWLPPAAVQQVLLEINARFTQPKTEAEVLKEVEAGFAWTRGDGARPQNGPPGFRRTRPPAVTLGKLQELGKKLKRRVGQGDMGDAFVQLSRREAFCLPEEALTVSRGLARIIAEHFPQADPNQAASLFAPSLAIMRSQAGPAWDAQVTQDLIQNIIHASQHDLQRQRQHQEDDEARARNMRIERATGGARNTPYSADEFAEFARQQHCLPEELLHRLVIQYGPSFFAFVNGNYTAAVEQGVAEFLLDALSAGEPLGVDLFRTTMQGAIKLRTSAELVQDYGVVAEDMVVSLYAPQSSYDVENKRFIWAASPIRRHLQPERVLEVEHYLESIGSEALLDWLAFVPRLDRPSKALYLWGDPDVGKSFLALCLSRLWSDAGASTGHDLVDDFNSSITRCPLIFMDEQLPVEFRGRRGTERLRHEIQAITRPYHAKFRSKVQVQGALRFMFAANHPHMVETDDTLTSADAEGVRQRIEVVHVPTAAKQYLRSLGRERTERWLSDDLFAKHVLYLRDTRELPPLGRFGPERVLDDVSYEAKLVYDNLRFSGVGGQLLLWVYKALSGDVPPPPGALVWGRAQDREVPVVLLNFELVEQYWQLVLGNQTKIPSRQNLRAAFDTLSIGRARVYVGHKRRRYHVINGDAFNDWLRINEADYDALVDRTSAMVQKGTIDFVLESTEGQVQ